LRTAGAARALEAADIAEKLLKHGQLLALGRGLAAAEVDDLPILNAVIGKGHDLIIGIEANREDLALGFDRIENAVCSTLLEM